MRLMRGIGGWCRRGEGGKRYGVVCACEGKGLNCVVNIVIVRVGNVDGV